jgi:DNA-binding GntR family transcriptional regulator
MKPLAITPGLTEQVYRTLRDEICEGSLAPGTHLRQEQLAQTLGVSRQPIQQALALLRNDGLVQELGKRGLFVTPLDPTIMRHHYAIRAALDGLAARLAAEEASRSRQAAERIRSEGARLVQAGMAAAGEGRVAALVDLDVAFHAFIYEASGNPLLAATADLHWRYLRRVMSEVLRQAEPPPAIWQQHADILSAIVAGTPDDAERLAIRHVQHASSRLSAALEAGSGAA